jgi:Na+/melibiose symporter-like transporter
MLDCDEDVEESDNMNAGRVIATIAAGILIFFGVLFIWGAFSPNGSTGWIVTGLISVAAGFVLIWLSRRRPAAADGKQEIVQHIELSGDVSLERLTCRSCGGKLSSDNVKVVAGAPVVNCPYCGASYQLEEAPKW